MGGLYQELKRRKVFRVGGAYLVAAWLLLQVSDLLVPVLSLPEWTTRIVFLLLAIGFIPALIMAWAFEMTPDGLAPESKVAKETSGAQKAGNRYQAIISTVLLLVLVGIATGWFLGRDQRWARDVAFPQIEAHAAAGEWEDAFALAKDVEAVLPDDPYLAALWETFAWSTSIPSEPVGAKVLRRPYADQDAPWEELGTTPIYDTHIPRGLSLLQLEIEGRPPLLRMIGGGTDGSSDLSIRESPVTHNPQIRPGAFAFDTNESLPDGMVRVPGMTLEIAGASTTIKDFYIDQYEVTNRQFKEFVNSGGYSRRDLWEHDFIVDDSIVSWESAMQRFVDASGRPGPRTWEAGIYPDNEDSHPVAGVSWYEAAAYARFKRRELPTVHHWRRAFAEGLLAWIIPESNLEASGTAPAGQFSGVGWTGTSDMVGNVREWCFNVVGDQRAMLGGGWNDVPYEVLESITNPGSVDPFDESVTNGFRLIVPRDEAPDRERLQAPIDAETEVLTGEPVSNEVFAAFRNHFEYDRGPLNASLDDEVAGRHWTRQQISFSSGSDKSRMTLYLYLPDNGASRHQVILYWPTISALVLDSIDEVNVPLDFALANGRAVAFPILDGTFERRETGFPDWSSIAGRDLVIRQMRDMRRTIDYLETRDDIDANALAFFGFSWGGRLGSIAMAVEPRIKVGILNQAGLQHLSVPETSVLNYLPRVTVPVLQFNGIYDTDFRFDTSAKPYFNMLGTPDADKKHVVAPTGHFVPRAVVVGETLDWLDKYLGPVNRHEN